MVVAHSRLELSRSQILSFRRRVGSLDERLPMGPKSLRLAAWFDALANALAPVRTPIGDAWILEGDEAAFRAPKANTAPARLLPSGDTYYLLWDSDRELLVPNAEQRASLWTSRVWPGALLVNGEIAGIWRRSAGEVSIEAWRRLSPLEEEAAEAEAASLPLPGLDGPITVRWG